MAHGNQLRGALGRLDARNSRYFQRIALGILRQRPQHLPAHGNKRIRFGLPQCGTLARHVHHRRAPGSVVVRKLLRSWSWPLPWCSGQQHRDCFSGFEPLAIRRYHNVAVRLATPPSGLPNPASGPVRLRACRARRPACAGRNRVSPVLVVNGAFKIACTNGSGSGVAPAKRIQHRPHEQLERDHGRYRIARQTKEWRGPCRSARLLRTPLACRVESPTPVKKNFAPSDASTSSTRSYLPIETPPVSSSRSASSPLRSRSASSAASSRATGSSMASPPAS